MTSVLLNNGNNVMGLFSNTHDAHQEMPNNYTKKFLLFTADSHWILYVFCMENAKYCVNEVILTLIYLQLHGKITGCPIQPTCCTSLCPYGQLAESDNTFQ